MTMHASPPGFSFDPASPEFVDDPYPTYKVLRDHHPAYHLQEHGLWLITRQADVLAALTNPAVWLSRSRTRIRGESWVGYLQRDSSGT